MAARDDNVFFYEKDLYTLSQNGASIWPSASSATDDQYWDYKLQTSTFSITWFWFIPYEGDELMIVKGRPDTGLTITARCDMGSPRVPTSAGADGSKTGSCSGTDNMLKFDLHYLICFIRFGYNPYVMKNTNFDCGWTNFGA
jgi:hypothetical protein